MSINARGRLSRLLVCPAALVVCVALVLTGAAVWLHVQRFEHAGSLWRDEAAAVNVASRPGLHALWSDLGFEMMPALYPLLLRGWTSAGGAGWGAGDAGLRALGLILGLTFLAALWCRSRLTRRGPPLLPLALLGLTPAVIIWGDAVRHHGLALILLVLADALWLRAALRPARGRVTAAAVAAALCLHASYQNAPALIGLMAAAVVVVSRNHGRRPALRVGVAGAAALLSLLIYTPLLLGAARWSILIRDGNPAGIWPGVQRALGSPAAAWVWAGLVGGAVIVGVAIVAALSRRDRGPAPGLVDDAVEVARFGLVSLAAGTAAFAVYFRVSGYASTWHHLPLLCLAALSGDSAIAPLKRAGAGRAAVLLATILAAAILWPRATAVVRLPQSNVRQVAEVLKARAGARDLVLVDPWYAAISLGRYDHGEAPCASLPDMSGVGIHRYDLVKACMMSSDPAGPLLARIERTLRAGGTLWIAGDLLAPPGGAPPKALRPAPQEGTWSEASYTLAWSHQVGHLIRQHAGHVELLVPAAPRPGGAEHLKLRAISGWRD